MRGHPLLRLAHLEDAAVVVVGANDPGLLRALRVCRGADANLAAKTPGSNSFSFWGHDKIWAKSRKLRDLKKGRSVMGN